MIPIMRRKENKFVIFFMITGFAVGNLASKPLVVKDNDQFVKLELKKGESEEKNTILLEGLERQGETSDHVKEDLKILSSSETVEGGVKTKETGNEEIRPKRRNRRQSRNTNSLLDSVSQECDGITLRWVLPNIPYSKIYHTSNPEFSHYNIYRQTRYFSSVVGLTPFTSGKDLTELRKITTDKWTDKFPPVGTTLFYAVTVVDHTGKETQNVTPKQVTFYGGIEKTGINPTRIIPNALNGDVLHHSVAFNSFRNEYMVAFDLDVNKDGTPDRVYAMRVNGMGQIVDQRVLDATVGIASTEQGRPSVAFNPSTQQYLIAFQLSAPSLFRGASIIVGQRVFSHRTDRFKNPFVMVKGTRGSTTFLPVVEPKLVYNSGSGGFTMTASLVQSPKTTFAIFLKSDGTISVTKRLFRGEVLDANLFMDTRARQVYFIYQIAVGATTITQGEYNLVKKYPYIIVATKATAFGKLLTLNDPTIVRYLVGYTKEQPANIAGYFNQNNGWLTVFWNNNENGKRLINSSNIFGVSGTFIREDNVNSCPTQTQVQNPASCYLPNNNGHILLWEEGSRVGGFLVKDDTFLPVLGEQRQARVVYNRRERRAFVVWKQKFRGNFALFVRNVHPGSRFSCRVSCKWTQRCAMKDVCAPRNPVVNKPTCAKDNGGCSHTCLSSPKGRKCSCPSSHVLSLDGMKCFLKDAKADVSLLYSTGGSVWSLSVYYKEKRVTFAKIPVYGQQIISFAYNEKDKFLYWAETRNSIKRAYLDGSGQQVLINYNVQVVDGMIVDSVGKLIYWSDVNLKTIFRCSLDGKNRISFISWLDKPRALALHKPNNWLFWTDWGTVPKIERINTDGTYRRVLFDTGLGWPNGLAIDKSSLYWADAKLDKIEMSDLNGQGRVLVTGKGLVHPFALDIAGNRLYWSDWKGDIRSFDKSARFSLPEIIAAGIKRPDDLQVYGGTAVKKASFCTDPGVPTNGGRNPPPTSGGKYKVGDRVILTCNPGFVHLGSHDRRCLSTGKWSGNDTQCKVLPSFTTLPKNKTVDVGVAVILECSASSKSGSNPKITWYKNGKTILPSPNGRYFQMRVTNFFFFLKTVVDDTGTYTCVASNDAGEIRASMFLRVRSQIMVDCGKAKFKARAKIIGGHRAAPGSIPWQVLLWHKRSRKPFCGGSLLNTRWGVTAAHCLSGFLQLAHIEVRLGEYDWKISEKTEQYMSIDKVHIHTQYNDKTYDSDIALFRLKTKAIMTDYVKPICLPEKQSDQALLQANNVGRISGWGARNANKTRPVRKLHEVLVPLVNQTICQRSHSTYHVSGNMFCAGRTDGKGDACQGDSGGPLTIENKKTGRSVLIGIVSWGDKCGAKNKYGVYTKVPNFVNWINNHIKHV